MRGWVFLAAVPAAISVCLLAGPGYAQQGASATAAAPDMGGIWAQTRRDFEPPESGPGPVKNTSKVVGVDAGDYNSPILKPWAAEIIKRRAELQSRTGEPLPNPHNSCRPEGTPFIFGVAQMQILQTPKQVTLLYYTDHQVRTVAMNVPHAAHPLPSWTGDSVGHYEGDVLVIDTIAQKASQDRQVDRYGTPFTEALHVVERYRLVDSDTVARTPERVRVFAGPQPVYVPRPGSKTLELRFTVEDSGAFTTPWSGVVHYERWKDGDTLTEHVCPENNRDFFRKELFPIPVAAQPDF